VRVEHPTCRHVEAFCRHVEALRRLRYQFLKFIPKIREALILCKAPGKWLTVFLWCPYRKLHPRWREGWDQVA
jgi:hypothetical protein